MTQDLPVLHSVCKRSKYGCFPFHEDQIKIGRSSDMTYTILSEKISLCHAIIEKQADNTWTITDDKSLNGISVNNKKLNPLEPYTLQEGDVVQLGVSTDDTTPAEFVYRYFSSLKVRREPKASSQQKAATSTATKHPLAVSDQNAGVSKKRKGEAEEEVEQENKPVKTDFEVEMETLIRQLQEAKKENMAIMQELQKERQERQAVEKRQKEQERKVTMMGSTWQMKEQAAAAGQIYRQLTEQMKEREQQMRHRMQQKLQTVTEEKKQTEERLLKEMEKTVREKDQELQNRLQEEKDRLQKVIEAMEKEQETLEFQLADIWVQSEIAKEEQKDLKLQLAETFVEKEAALEKILLTREAILSKFADIMKTELQCSICNEMFVKATSLNCSHAFCSLCIRQWLARKKQCPNCRAGVTSHTRSVLLDNYIDRMVEQLSEEMKERRAALVAERKEAEAKLDEADSSALSSSDDEDWEHLTQYDSAQSPSIDEAVFSDNEDNESESELSSVYASSSEHTHDFPLSSSDLEDDLVDEDGDEGEHRDGDRHYCSCGQVDNRGHESS